MASLGHCGMDHKPVLVRLIHPTAGKNDSRKSVYRILDARAPKPCAGARITPIPGPVLQASCNTAGWICAPVDRRPLERRGMGGGLLYHPLRPSAANRSLARESGSVLLPGPPRLHPRPRAGVPGGVSWVRSSRCLVSSWMFVACAWRASAGDLVSPYSSANLRLLCLFLSAFPGFSKGVRPVRRRR